MEDDNVVYHKNTHTYTQRDVEISNVFRYNPTYMGTFNVFEHIPDIGALLFSITTVNPKHGRSQVSKMQ